MFADRQCSDTRRGCRQVGATCYYMAALNFMAGASDAIQTHIRGRDRWWGAYAPILEFAARMRACTTDDRRGRLCERLPASLVALRSNREPSIADWGNASVTLVEFLNAPSPRATYGQWCPLEHAGVDWERTLAPQIASHLRRRNDTPFYVVGIGTDIGNAGGVLTGLPISVADVIMSSVAPAIAQIAGARLLGGVLRYDMHAVAFHPCANGGAFAIVVTDSQGGANLHPLGDYLAGLRHKRAVLGTVSLVYAAPAHTPLPSASTDVDMPPVDGLADWDALVNALIPGSAPDAEMQK